MSETTPTASPAASRHHKHLRAGAYHRFVASHIWRLVLRRPALWLSVLAVLIGLMSGLGAIMFRLMVDEIQQLLYGASEALAYSSMKQLPWWHLMLAPVLGGLAVGLLRLLLPERQVLGIADIIAASTARGGRIALGTALSSAAASIVALGSGASTGREGPTVHLAASLASWLAQQLQLNEAMIRTLVGCGVAAGVAASFNAPIAGVFFALEVVVGHYALSAFAPIVIAGVVGTMVSRMVFGDFPAISLPDLPSPAPLDYLMFAVLGLIAAAVALAQLMAIRQAQGLFQRLAIPMPFKTMLAGFCIGLIALVMPEVIGGGYEPTDLILGGSTFTMWLLVAMVFGKILSTALTFGSGFAAGIFAPALFLGAAAGAAFSNSLSGLGGGLGSLLHADAGLYGVVGMGAVAAAVLGAPISTILIIFEMTGDYTVTTAVMIGVVVAALAFQTSIGDEFSGGYFAWLLRRRGVNIGAGREQGIIRNITVGALMKRDFSLIEPGADYASVLDQLRRAVRGQLFVVDDQRRLQGVITIPDLNAAVLAAEMTPDQLTAFDLARRSPPLLAVNDSLDLAMETMESAGESHLPVVDSLSHGVLVGYLHEHDVMAAYYRALLRARAEERGERPAHEI